jgi:hypothetical protein
MKMLGIPIGRILFLEILLVGAYKLHERGFYFFYKLYQSCNKEMEGY